jgi:hypothetical protein
VIERRDAMIAGYKKRIANFMVDVTANRLSMIFIIDD